MLKVNFFNLNLTGGLCVKKKRREKKFKFQISAIAACSALRARTIHTKKRAPLFIKKQKLPGFLVVVSCFRYGADKNEEHAIKLTNLLFFASLLIFSMKITQAKKQKCLFEQNLNNFL